MAISEAVRPEPLLNDEFDVVLERTRGLRSLRLRELWAHRELLYFLTWRDVKVRYKQSLLGVGWAVLQPVTTMILFTIVFGHVANVSSQGIPYPVFSYAALVPWFLFAMSVQLSSLNLVGSSQLITKVYFPRIFLAASPAIAGLLDLGLALLVLFALMGYYGIAPSIGVIALPGFVLIALAVTLGIAAWLSALNVKYRDVRYIVPFFVQIWFFATPVVYSIASLAQPWKTLYALNPMTGVVEGFRWALAGAAAPDGTTIVVSSASAIAIMLLGCYYFGRAERQFADLI
jgi:homopolymeric O-antigen transport system permease protein